MDELTEVIARRFAKGNTLAAGGPWCPICGVRRPPHPKSSKAHRFGRLYAHLHFEHELENAKLFCRLFYIRWNPKSRILVPEKTNAPVVVLKRRLATLSKSAVVRSGLDSE
jgi:hypothetical protein